ncbi:MAG: hypothetical protein IH623_12840 [Verrucomicrobia bacterium]|nr:hypothetical protein [Verrucomicrobiota bacterium]
MLTLECNYSKKIGLPHYSSHQFMVTLRTEITDLSTVQTESDRLYGLLQSAVDTALQRVGYLPEAAARNGNGHTTPRSNGNNDRWQCSDKQRDLILKLTDEHKLDKNAVEQLAQDRFGKNVKALNKLEASGLIDELLIQTGQKQGNRRFNHPTPARAA